MKKLMTIGFLLFPLILTGCGSKDAPVELAPQITEETVLQGTTDQQAYLACTQAGNEIRIVHDSQKNRRVIYCVFPDNSRCDARVFMQDGCEEGRDFSRELVLDFDESTDGLADGPRFCETSVHPVCGIDGRSYSNECFARLNGVAISNDGACQDVQFIESAVVNSYIVKREKDEGQPNSTDPATGVVGKPVDAPAENQSPQIAPSQARPQHAPLPDWADIPISLIAQSDRVISATLEECNLTGTKVYVQTEGSNQGFAVMYNENGSVICYPTNDVDNACPGNFNYERRASICSVVWEK